MIIKPITEKQFEAQIKELALLFNWMYYHTWRSIHSPAGFPDCVMVRQAGQSHQKGRVIFAELKSDKGQLSDKQREWIDILRACGTVEVYVWRPRDFDKVVEVLR